MKQKSEHPYLENVLLEIFRGCELTVYNTVETSKVIKPVNTRKKLPGIWKDTTSGYRFSIPIGKKYVLITFHLSFQYQSVTII